MAHIAGKRSPPMLTISGEFIEKANARDLLQKDKKRVLNSALSVVYILWTTPATSIHSNSTSFWISFNEALLAKVMPWQNSEIYTLND